VPLPVHDNIRAGRYLEASLPSIKKARKLADMTAAIHQTLESPWAVQLRVVNIRTDVIVIFAASAAALTSARVHRRRILEFLNTRFCLDCTNIEAKVVPPGRDAGQV
jgi:hypothetical protein